MIQVINGHQRGVGQNYLFLRLYKISEPLHGDDEIIQFQPLANLNLRIARVLQYEYWFSIREQSGSLAGWGFLFDEFIDVHSDDQFFWMVYFAASMVVAKGAERRAKASSSGL